MRGALYLPISPYMSLYLPICPYISLHLPISPSISSLRVGVRVAVRLDDELREALVLDHIDAILDHADAVEAREDGLGQVDVILEGE